MEKLFVIVSFLVFMTLFIIAKNQGPDPECRAAVERLERENDSLLSVINRMQRSFDLCYTYKNNIHKVEELLD